MTVTMVIIIVAGVVIIAFGVLCLLSMNKAQRETQNMAEKMIAVERNLGDVSRMVSRSAETSRTTDETIILELQRQAKKQAELEAGMAQVRAQREIRSLKVKVSGAYILPSCRYIRFVRLWHNLRL